jgi:hypothetical protein
MELFGRLKSFLRKVMIDGFSRQEQAVILKWLRLIVFVSVTLLLAYTLSGLTNMSEIFASPRLQSGAPDDRGLLRIFVLMVGVPFWLLIGLYWIGNLLDMILRFIKSALVYPLSKRVRKLRRKGRDAATNTWLWKVHSRIYYFFERIGEQHLLLRSLRYLEPELNSQETTGNFDPQTIDLTGTTITTKTADLILARYERFSYSILMLLVLFSFLALLAVLNFRPFIAAPNSLLSTIGTLSVFWAELIWFIMIFGCINPMRRREKAWHDARESLWRKERTLSVAAKAEGDLGRHIEELKALYESEAKKLRATHEELAQIQQSWCQIKNLAQNEQQTIVYLVNTVFDLEKRRQEALEKMLRPQQIIRDLLVGVGSNLIWGLIGGFVLGWLVGASR